MHFFFLRQACALQTNQCKSQQDCRKQQSNGYWVSERQEFISLLSLSSSFPPSLPFCFFPSNWKHTTPPHLLRKVYTLENYREDTSGLQAYVHTTHANMNTHTHKHTLICKKDMTFNSNKFPLPTSSLGIHMACIRVIFLYKSFLAFLMSPIGFRQFCLPFLI